MRAIAPRLWLQGRFQRLSWSFHFKSPRFDLFMSFLLSLVILVLLLLLLLMLLLLLLFPYVNVVALAYLAEVVTLVVAFVNVDALVD